ncbi:hypothetical protein BVG16_03635 [Paenibacillus selenitireducens]|uniref:Uncharacterized protein n=1 Tax=Paenibacillus selenitireducens TaxID=1324314 RepID=A0A1T2XP13_9BACL|nr:hypothetical protein [Paenibacillus selenitireducens]OPA81413.1 hypothetical protein BVG16_03635 [Paenibacillus selenitireducens]
MKMTGFLLGGMLGAAAAVYFSNNKQAMLAKAGEMGQSMNGWMGKAKDKVIEVTLSPALKDDAQATSSTSTSSTANSTQSAGAGTVSSAPTATSNAFMNNPAFAAEFGSDQASSSAGASSTGTQLKDLINKSASVKREVDAILKENNTSL